MTRARRTPLVLLEASTLLSSTGNGVTSVALPWLVLERTGSPTAAGVVAAATALPLLAGSLLAGTLVDAFGRERPPEQTHHALHTSCPRRRAPRVVRRGRVPAHAGLGPRRPRAPRPPPHPARRRRPARRGRPGRDHLGPGRGARSGADRRPRPGRWFAAAVARAAAVAGAR